MIIHRCWVEVAGRLLRVTAAVGVRLAHFGSAVISELKTGMRTEADISQKQRSASISQTLGISLCYRETSAIVAGRYTDDKNITKGEQ